MRRIGAVVALAMIAGAGCQKKTEEKQAPAAAPRADAPPIVIGLSLIHI